MASALSEQDKILREKLRQLARSENAKLIEGLNISTGLSDDDDTAESSPVHRHNISIDSMDTPIHPNVVINQSMKSTAQISNKKLKRKLKANSIYVMTDEDLEKLKQATTVETTTEPSKPGPSRPGDIEGTILSWKMTQDIVKTSAKSLSSAKRSNELAHFLWATFSQPENFSDLFHDLVTINQPLKLLPPMDVVQAMRNELPNLPILVVALLAKVGNLLKSCTCTGFAFSIIFVQVMLISIMVLAYVIGDIVIAPAKYLQEWVTTNNKPSKAKLSRKRTGKRSKKAN